MKTIYLLRHAKAEPGSKVLSDMDRPLSARGREACLQMGEYMKRKRYIPAQTLASPSIRTRETFERVALALEAQLPHQLNQKLYLATAGEIIQELQQLPEAVSSVLIIGHNPGIHHAALTLASTEETTLRHTLELKYPTASLAVLQFAVDDWKQVTQGQGALIDFITPEELSFD